jgi:probable addiction module antidote protein
MEMMMTMLVKTPFDAAKYITEPEDVIDFLNDALESGHAPYIAAVLGDVARSEGMTKIAEKTGVNRQALYTALSENGNPTLETLLKVMAALGIRLKCEAVGQAKAA